jgi:hypothetical protein
MGCLALRVAERLSRACRSAAILLQFAKQPELRMDDNSPHDDSPSPEAPWPAELAHLRCLFDVPDLSALDDEEYLTFFRTRLAELQKHQELLRCHGRDVTELIDALQHHLSEFERTVREADEAQEKALQATADLADAERNFVKVAGPIIDRAYEENPFKNEIQDMKAHLDEARKHLPKDL